MLRLGTSSSNAEDHLSRLLSGSCRASKMSENKPSFYLALNAVRAPRRPRRSAAGALGVVHRPADAEAEFEGFTEAKIILTEELDDPTRYTVAYIQSIHQLALGHL